MCKRTEKWLLKTGDQIQNLAQRTVPNPLQDSSGRPRSPEISEASPYYKTSFITRKNIIINYLPNLKMQL
jgi:hypothetical protein